MRESNKTNSTQASGSTGSTGSSNWPLPIIGITVFTTISALGGVELFNGTLTLSGVSTTVISGLIAFMSMSALCLICWGASKWVEGENTSRHMGDFLNFIKNLSIYIGTSAALSASLAWGQGITLSFLQTTPLSAIAATTPLSTFLVGTVVLTIALPALYLILKALGQCMANQAQKIASSLKEAWKTNDLAPGATAQGQSPKADDLAPGATAQGQSRKTDDSQAEETAHNEDNDSVLSR